MRNSRQTLPGARSPSPHSRGAACHASRGNCVPEIMRKVGCGFRLRARWKTASHFGYKFRDALSAEVLNRKLHPIPKANSGTHLPQPHPSGKPFHPESPSHSEYIQRTHASVLSRTASSSGRWKKSPQTLAAVVPTSVKKKASRTSRLSHLYCFARRIADGEATLPVRPSWRLRPCYPDLPWWDGPSQQSSCRAASYSARCRDLARAWPRSAA